jgi:hypothetical protein
MRVSVGTAVSSSEARIRHFRWFPLVAICSRMRLLYAGTFDIARQEEAEFCDHRDSDTHGQCEDSSFVDGTGTVNYI